MPILSLLTMLETQSAFAVKVRTADITTDDLDLLRKRLKADVSQRRLLVTRVLRRHIDRAERLLVKYGPQHRLRSLNAIHLDVVLDLRVRGHVDALVMADGLHDRLV